MKKCVRGQLTPKAFVKRTSVPLRQSSKLLKKRATPSRPLNTCSAPPATPCNVGGAVLPTTLRWAVEAALQGWHSPTPLSFNALFVVVGVPPAGSLLVSAHDARDYLLATPNEAASMLRRWCRRHAAQPSNPHPRELTDASLPSIHWEALPTGSSPMVYGIPAPWKRSSPSWPTPTCVPPSPYWLPLRLMYHLPHFPIPMVQAAHHSLPHTPPPSLPSSSSLKQLGIPIPYYKALIDPSRKKCSNALPAQLAHFGPLTVMFPHQNSAYSVTGFWLRHRDPLRFLPVDVYLPMPSFSYFYSRRRVRQIGAEHRNDGDGVANPSRSNVRCWNNVVSWNGSIYVNAADTHLAPFMDTSVCVAHAVPLTEDGDVFFAAINVLRIRSQLHLYGLFQGDWSVPELYGKPEKEVGRTCVKHDWEATGKPSTTTLWMDRLRRVLTKSSHPIVNLPYDASPHHRLSDWRENRRAHRFIFRSPYWVDAGTVRERWGVEVRQHAIPTLIDGRLFVNAEETSDASRFNATTCVPRHEVLTLLGLRSCSFTQSRSLDEALENRAKKSENRLWISTDVMGALGWTQNVRTTPVHMSWAGLCPSNGGADDTNGAIVVIHVDDIHEEDAVRFVATYSPSLMMAKISPLDESDEVYGRLQKDLASLVTMMGSAASRHMDRFCIDGLLRDLSCHGEGNLGLLRRWAKTKQDDARFAEAHHLYGRIRQECLTTLEHRQRRQERILWRTHRLCSDSRMRLAMAALRLKGNTEHVCWIRTDAMADVSSLVKDLIVLDEPLTIALQRCTDTFTWEDVPTSVVAGRSSLLTHEERLRHGIIFTTL